MGSVTMRRATAAEAAADKLRNERRDVEETLRSRAIAHLTASNLTLELDGKKQFSDLALQQNT
jgi:hypothetical protein